VLAFHGTFDYGVDESWVLRCVKSANLGHRKRAVGVGQRLGCPWALNKRTMGVVARGVWVGVCWFMGASWSAVTGKVAGENG